MRFPSPPPPPPFSPPHPPPPSAPHNLHHRRHPPMSPPSQPPLHHAMYRSVADAVTIGSANRCGVRRTVLQSPWLCRYGRCRSEDGGRTAMGGRLCSPPSSATPTTSLSSQLTPSRGCTTTRPCFFRDGRGPCVVGTYVGHCPAHPPASPPPASWPLARLLPCRQQDDGRPPYKQMTHWTNEPIGHRRHKHAPAANNDFGATPSSFDMQELLDHTPLHMAYPMYIASLGFQTHPGPCHLFTFLVLIVPRCRMLPIPSLCPLQIQ